MTVPPSQRDELRAKFVEFAATGDVGLRDDLVAAHLGLAEYLARRFANRGEPLDDLVQVASLGLLKAVGRFDPERGVEFSTYATHTIVGELKRHFRDKGWAIRAPRRMQELYLRLGKVVATLGQELGRSPTIAELLGLPSVSFSKKVSVADGKVMVDRQTESGYDEVEVPLPALVTVTAGVVEPRYPSFKGIMAAKGKPVEELKVGDLGLDASQVGVQGARQETVSVVPADAREAGEIVVDEGDGYQKIVSFLEQLKVI
jgi:RNA polymerase sigma factor (sigma-70 family)